MLALRDDDHMPATWALPALQRPRRPQSRPRRVLIVDRNWRRCDDLADRLEAAHYESVCTTSADEGWRLVLHFTPDVVVLNVDTTGLPGRRLLSQLRKPLPAVPMPRALMLVGHQVTEHSEGQVTAATASSELQQCNVEVAEFVTEDHLVARLLRLLSGESSEQAPSGDHTDRPVESWAAARRA